MHTELGVIGLGLIFVGAIVLLLDETTLISTSTSSLVGWGSIVLGVVAGLASVLWPD